jgi:NADH dehydrogenase/NADH:ubiquinone oxidoreductase subunit G
MPTAVLLNIKESCNSSGAELLNLKALSKNDLLKAEVLLAVNLDDTLLVRRILSQASTKMVMWLNTHGSQLGAKTDYIVPTTTAFEAEGIYLNLENRPQKSLKTLAGVGEMRSTNVIFNSIKNEYTSSKFLEYIYELIEKNKYFSSITNTLLKGSLFNSNQISTVSLYPAKTIEDFYTKGKFNKNSSVMLQCSQEVRKSSSNF